MVIATATFGSVLPQTVWTGCSSTSGDFNEICTAFFGITTVTATFELVDEEGDDDEEDDDEEEEEEDGD